MTRITIEAARKAFTREKSLAEFNKYLLQQLLEIENRLESLGFPADSWKALLPIDLYWATNQIIFPSNFRENFAVHFPDANVHRFSWGSEEGFQAIAEAQMGAILATVLKSSDIYLEGFKLGAMLSVFESQRPLHPLRAQVVERYEETRTQKRRSKRPRDSIHKDVPLEKMIQESVKSLDTPKPQKVIKLLQQKAKQGSYQVDTDWKLTQVILRKNEVIFRFDDISHTVPMKTFQNKVKSAIKNSPVNR